MHDRNNFDFSKRAILINRSMPKFSIKLINEQYKNFKNKKVALFGATYKEDIDDTRFSPSENIAKELINKMNETRHLGVQRLTGGNEIIFSKN